MTARHLVFALLASAATARAETLTLLDTGLDPARVDAIRTETTIRGLRFERLATTGDPALATALAERPGVIAVVWTTATPDGDVLHVRTADGREAHAPLGVAPPRAVAAIAGSLLDDALPAAPVIVDVDVRVAAPALPVPAIAERRADPIAAPASRWFADVGGIVAPHGIFAAHAGFGRRTTAHTRAALVGHLASVPDAYAVAGSLQLSRIWGRRVRAELGARGLVTMVRDDGCATCMTTSEVGIGAGGFVGLGVGTAFGTFYLRAGADLVRFDEGASVTPNGALGLELPL